MRRRRAAKPQIVPGPKRGGQGRVTNLPVIGEMRVVPCPRCRGSGKVRLGR